MSDDSLFSKHWRLIDQDSKTWSEDDKKEFHRLQDLQLPPLELKVKPKVSLLDFWMKFRMQIQLGATALVMASLAVVMFLPQKDILSAKGALQVSVFWERGGKVAPLAADTTLKDGDKVGARVNSAEAAFAYWAITDNNLKVLTTAEDVEASRILLESGVAKSFESSFVLTAPNQGEHLVVVVCPMKEMKSEAKSNAKKPIDTLFNHEFVSQLITEQRVLSSNCVFVGSRLRSMP